MLKGNKDLAESFADPGRVIALAAKLLSVNALTQIPHHGVVVRISNCDVVASMRKAFEEMFKVSDGSLGR
jgi:hypothetical protein